MAEHCRVLAQAGHVVRVLTWRDTAGSTWRPEFCDVIRVPYWRKGSERLFYDSGAPDNLRRRPWSALQAVPALAAMLARSLRGDPPDLVIGHWLIPGGLLARAVGRVLDRPSLVVGHSGGVHLLGRLPAPLRSVVARELGSGVVTVPTRALAAKLPFQTTVLPMGIKVGDDWGCGQRHTALCLGRLIPLKGFDVALDAAEAAQLERVIVVGDGPERSALQRRASGLRVDVELRGAVPHCELGAQFREAGLLLAPSRHTRRHEGLSVAVLEAAAAGLVPLVGGYPGAEEAVPDESLVVRGWDPVVWASAVARYRDAPLPEYESLRARAQAFGRSFDWRHLGPRWLEVVEGAA